ncbi:lipase member H isoform X2 [Protopterus annectens]|uniref:lipase member H isoform X2 n=1 Tax=Protopterus annectens TaxID=7888 RepID=UPI001CFA166A|nr:lipase member H isoform X2 [Protopterus annectens]
MFWLIFCSVFLRCLASSENEEKCHEFTDLNFGHSVIGTKLNLKLLLYTRENENCARKLDHENVTISRLNVTRRTTFIIHGYRPTGSPPVWLDDIVKLLLMLEDMNVIIVDWNEGATTILYNVAAEMTKKVADILEVLLRNMVNQGAALDQIHMIGVSLGAHISGFVGQKFKGQIGRITGLDPAGPLFKDKSIDERLDPSDAQFVDVIHTDIDGKQYLVCDHQRSVFLFLNSLKPECNITTYPCASYSEFQKAACTSCDALSLSQCPTLGYWVDKWKDTLKSHPQTKFYFDTTSKMPFCVHYYLLDIIVWGKVLHWGFIEVKLADSSGQIVQSMEDRTEAKFEQYNQVTLLIKFDEDLQKIAKIFLTFHTNNVIGPKYKLRILRLRLRPLTHPDRPHLCRYDIIAEENTEVSFKPMPCQNLKIN